MNQHRKDLENSRNLVKFGNPQNDDAEREFSRIENARRANVAAQLLKESRINYSTKQTTAEPRANAYIPEEFGGPKPVSLLIPCFDFFRTTQLTSPRPLHLSLSLRNRYCVSMAPWRLSSQRFLVQR